MTRNLVKSLLFLIVFARQLALIALIIFHPMICNMTTFHWAILSAIPLYLMSLAICNEIRYKYKLEAAKNVTRRFGFISITLACLYAFYPIGILLWQLHCPMPAAVLALCLSAGETLFGVHLRTIFRDLFKPMAKK